MLRIAGNSQPREYIHSHHVPINAAHKQPPLPCIHLDNRNLSLNDLVVCPGLDSFLNWPHLDAPLWPNVNLKVLRGVLYRRDVVVISKPRVVGYNILEKFQFFRVDDCHIRLVLIQEVNWGVQREVLEDDYVLDELVVLAVPYFHYGPRVQRYYDIVLVRATHVN